MQQIAQEWTQTMAVTWKLQRVVFCWYDSSTLNGLEETASGENVWVNKTFFFFLNLMISSTVPDLIHLLHFHGLPYADGNDKTNYSQACSHCIKIDRTPSTHECALVMLELTDLPLLSSVHSWC